MSTQQQPQQTTGNFGESTYGKRLDYTAPAWRDWWAMVLFYSHVILVIVVTVIFWTDIEKKMNDADVSVDAKAIFKHLTGVWVALAVVSVTAVICGLIWIQIMKMYPDIVIKFFLFLNIVAWIVLTVYVAIEGVTGAVVGCVLLILVFCLITYCAWPRIPFASVCLWIATRICQTYEGTILVALLCAFFSVCWEILWIFFFVGYIILGIIENNINGGVIFLMLISFYWGTQVWKTVTHTTTCGVAATWVFSPGKLDKPSSGAFRRTMTTSFGSVCFGSLIVAILSATRAMIRGMTRGNAICWCICYCIVLCIERLIKWFNLYAFAQVAIYGSSFLEAGMKTFQLLASVGIWALANDWVLSIAVTYSARITGVLCGLIGFFIVEAFIDLYAFAIAMAFVCALFGQYICLTVLFVIQSCVICLFVCFSEAPKALETNRPEEFAKLCDANQYMRNLANGQAQLNVQMAEQENGRGNTTQNNNNTVQQPNQPR